MSRYPQDRKHATYTKGWHDGIRAFIAANFLHPDGKIEVPNPPRLERENDGTTTEGAT